MIVKNESKTLPRLLQSVLPFIDAACICDTGSTDETLALIEAFAHAHPSIEVQVHHVPFRDFGYNRTMAFQQLANLHVKGLADYVLLVDADMVLRYKKDEEEKKKDEQEEDEGKQEQIRQWKATHLVPHQTDLIHLFQGSDTFLYKNARIVRYHPDVRYVGVTHEYLDVPSSFFSATIPAHELFLIDVGDGGSKADKGSRDVALLRSSLDHDPTNVRSAFYLANTYRDMGQWDDAKTWYERRVAMGDWFEERYCSAHELGKLYYYRLHDQDKAIHWWLRAIDIDTRRLESLAELVRHFRVTGQNQVAGLFLRHAYAKKVDGFHDALFVDGDVARYLLAYEATILGYYCDLGVDLCQASMEVWQHCPDPQRSGNTWANYKFYAPRLDAHQVHPLATTQKNLALLRLIGTTTGLVPAGFVASTPSLCNLKTPNHCQSSDRWYVCQRFVNYRIDRATGAYLQDTVIKTINVLAEIDVSQPLFRLVKESVLHYDQTHVDGRYEGQEDVRLYASCLEMRYTCVRGLNHGTAVEYGHIQVDNDRWCTKGTIVKTDRQVEKNWVLFGSEPLCVYQWHPLTIGQLVDDRFVPLQTTSTTPPTTTTTKNPFFASLRGSTHGIHMPETNEWWFVCHAVSHEDKRYYYHVLVTLDATTLHAKRVSKPFTFAKQAVEYCLGLLYDNKEDTLWFSYSRYDCENDYLVVDRSLLESWLQPVL